MKIIAIKHSSYFYSTLVRKFGQTLLKQIVIKCHDLNTQRNQSLTTAQTVHSDSECSTRTNNPYYIDQQTLQPDDDYVLPHQRFWMFDVLVCPPSATERFLWQLLVCGTVFHRTSLLPPLSPSSAVILNHISSHFLIRTAFWLFSFVQCQCSAHHFGHYNCLYV